MRDVTDNRTAELTVAEPKRGRGRPRKEGALSGAQRQAAYRARRKASESVAVTGNDPILGRQQIDQVDALKAELAESRATIDALNGAVRDLRTERDALWRGLEEAQAAHGRADADRAKLERDYKQLEAAAMKAAPKSVTRNGNPVSYEAMLDLLCLASKARTRSDLQDIRETDLWRDQVVCSDANYEEVWAALARERNVVTRKA